MRLLFHNNIKRGKTFIYNPLITGLSSKILHQGDTHPQLYYMAILPHDKVLWMIPKASTLVLYTTYDENVKL